MSLRESSTRYFSRRKILTRDNSTASEIKIGHGSGNRARKKKRRDPGNPPLSIGHLTLRGAGRQSSFTTECSLSRYVWLGYPNMVAPDSVKRGKSHLALAMFLIGAVLVGGPYLIARFGLMTGLKNNAWVILLVAYAGILLKAGLSFLTTKDFRYDKSAYELCVLTMGGMLTCLALQLTSNQDLFPGLEGISFLGFMSSLSLITFCPPLLLSVLLFVGALIAMVFSTIGVSDAEAGNTDSMLTLGTSLVGHALLGAYALILVAKG